MNLKEKLRSIIGNWVDVGLHEEFKKDYMRFLQQYIKKEREKTTVYPPSHQVFRALKLTGPKETKVCILGQNPFHDGSANGLAFSNSGDTDNISPSLRNIFKELENDLGENNIQHNPDLTRWAKQGVLLLNTSLTVREGYPNSHIIIRGKKLWQRFTSKIITYLSRRDQFTVFILWGNKAKDYKLRENPPINPFDNIRVIESSHPSPLGAYHSFWGSKPFSKANKFLEEQDIEPIQWK